MKKLLTVAFCWMIFSSCAKNVDTLADKKIAALPDTLVVSQAAIKEVAMVDYIADLGWVLKPGANEVQVADNLPQEYMKQGLQVLVVYTETNPKQGEVGEAGLSYIHIVNIGVLSPTD